MYSVFCTTSPYTPFTSKGFSYCSPITILNIYISHNGGQNVNFRAYVLLIDDFILSRERVFNQQIAHLWSQKNHHDVWHHATKHRFFLFFFSKCVGRFDRRNRLIGPYLLPSCMTSTNNRIFPEQVLPDLLDDVSPNVRRNMWFKNDGRSPSHFGMVVSEQWNWYFSHRSRDVLNHFHDLLAHWIYRALISSVPTKFSCIMRLWSLKWNSW